MAKVFLYTKTTCPYCVRAKALLTEKGVTFEEVRIDEHPDRRPEMIARSEGRTTVPQIFINDQPVGGCDDLHALNESGQLDKLLT